MQTTPEQLDWRREVKMGGRHSEMKDGEKEMAEQRV